MLAGHWDVRWSLDADSELTRVWCEGPEKVDDISLSLSSGQVALIQAKRTATLSDRPGSALGKALGQFVAAHLTEVKSSQPARLVLVVGRDASNHLVNNLTAVLDRVRGAQSFERRLLCRTDDDEDALDKACVLIRTHWSSIAKRRPSEADLLALLQHIWVSRLDVESDGTDRGRALDRLTPVLLQPEHRELAWTALVNHFMLAQKKQTGGAKEALQSVLNRTLPTRLSSARPAGAASSTFERDYLLAQRRELELLRAEVLAAQVGTDVPRLPLDATFVPLRARLSLGGVRADLLGRLPSRERRLLELRFGLGGGRPRTLRAIGSVFGLRSVRVRQIETETLKLLGEALASALADVPGAHLHTGRPVQQVVDVLRRGALTVPVVPLITAQPRLVLTGDPGTGKSSVLRYVAWQMSRRTSETTTEVPDGLPVRLAIADYASALLNDEDLSLKDALVRNAGRFGALVDAALENARAVVLLDGLDEVVNPRLRRAVAGGINGFLADPAYDDVRIVMTSRTLGYQPYGVLQDIPTVQLSPFDDAEIESFVHGWFSIRARDESRLDVDAETSRLRDRIFRDQRLKELAQTPLLLTLMALVDKQHGDLPRGRTALYATAFETLLYVWPWDRTDAPIEPDVAPVLLEPLAQHVFESPEDEGLRDPEVVELLAEAYAEMAPVTRAGALTAARQLLDVIEEHSGVLISRGQDADGYRRWRFLHRSFAEYLSARKLSNDWRRDAATLRYPPEPQWHDVLVMAAGELARQRSSYAGEFVDALRTLRSTPWEDCIARDLRLALAALADGISATGAEPIARLFDSALEVRRGTCIRRLRGDIELLFARLSGTPYASMLASRLQSSAEDSEVLAIARAIGGEYLVDRLETLLSSADSSTAAAAAFELSLAFPDRAVDLLSSRALDLGHPPEGVRAAIDLVAAQAPSRGAELYEQGARSSDIDVAFECVTGLTTIGSPYGPATLTNLLDLPGPLRRRIVDHLAESDDPEISPRLAKMIEEDPSRRWAAVEALERRSAAESLRAVERVMRAPGADGIAAAADVFSATRDPDAQKILVSALSAGPWSDRLRAADALAAADVAEALDVLTAALSDLRWRSVCSPQKR